MLGTYDELKSQVDGLKDQIDSLRNGLQNIETQFKTEKRQREENDLIITSQIASINNLLREKGLIEGERIDDAHSILYYCVICFARPHEAKFFLCGHTVCCYPCAQAIWNKSAIQRRCPICKTSIIRIEGVTSQAFLIEHPPSQP